MDDGHAHEHDEAGGAHAKVEDFVWKGTTALLAMYLFYLLEYLLHGMSSHTHSHVRPHPLLVRPRPLLPTHNTILVLCKSLAVTNCFLVYRVSPLTRRSVGKMERNASNWMLGYPTENVGEQWRTPAYSTQPRPVLRLVRTGNLTALHADSP